VGTNAKSKIPKLGRSNRARRRTDQPIGCPYIGQFVESELNHYLNRRHAAFFAVKCLLWLRRCRTRLSCGYSAHRAIGCNGKLNQNRLPLCGSLTTPIFPPINSTRCLEIAKPRPIPS